MRRVTGASASATMSGMRLSLLALAAGLTVAGLAPPAAGAVTALAPVTPVVAQPQIEATTTPVPPAVVDTAPVFAPEATAGRFAYPAVFLVPIALLAGAGWSIRAFTRDLLPTAA
ncbi:MAG TPA: hypothetical protein VNA14_13505 [Mycobacteriales bacterium]|nr:hypothetical protein [Mycobacteriales bacterium]